MEIVHSLNRLVTDTAKYLVGIRRGVVETEGRFWAEDRIDEAKMRAIWTVQSEMVEGVSNVARSPVVCRQNRVHQQLPATTHGQLGHQYLQRNVFGLALSSKVAAEPDVGKTTRSELVNNTISTVVAEKIVQVDGMVAPRLVVQHPLQSKGGELEPEAVGGVHLEPLIVKCG